MKPNEPTREDLILAVQRIEKSASLISAAYRNLVEAMIWLVGAAVVLAVVVALAK